MVIGKGSLHQELTKAEVRELLSLSLEVLPLSGKRLLVIIPDGTRTAPVAMFFSLLYEILGKRVKRLDYLIALGTHPAMSEQSIERLIGVASQVRPERYPNLSIFNHEWESESYLTTIGEITPKEVSSITSGLLNQKIQVRLNRRILDYDQILICGPVFPHEVVGFSGGTKYLIPGIAGPEIIDATHWLGALATNLEIAGKKDTPVRQVIDFAASFVTIPILYINLCLKQHVLHGLFIGDSSEAWNAAADLSAKLNIITVPNPYERILSIPSEKYDELWTAAKAFYKTESIVVEGGEVIVYAPHINKLSQSHGDQILKIGYHVRDYFTKQWGKFNRYPWAVLAHSTHLRGAGTFDNGIEKPRIQVTLATAIPPEICQKISLGYLDPRGIKLDEWKNCTNESRFLVQDAGETLYRLS